MGDIADAMLDGTLDCEDGSYLGEPCGFPRTSNPKSPHYYGRHDIASHEVEPPAETRVACPKCGRRVKTVGLADHDRDVHQR